MKPARQTKAIALCVALLLPQVTPAWADVLPPQAADVSERYRNNPKAFDRNDQWCDGRSVGDACSIPGNPLEGGGAGECQRNVHRSDFQIDLLCAVRPTPAIDRDMPDGSWRASASLCAQASKYPSTGETLRSQGWACDAQPVVVDRFCKGRTVGDRCTAQVRVGETVQAVDGVCKAGLDTQSSYFQGRITLTRDTVTCQGQNPMPERVLQPVSAWRKLFQ